MYQLQENGIKRLSDNASIPDDTGNRDYQEYLEWLAEGNIPEPMPLPSESVSFYIKNGTARLERNRQRLIDSAKESAAGVV